MASKGKVVKVQLKAAKSAVSKKEYQEVVRICKDIFAVDEGNYMAHVFAGLAGLELGRYADAKQHYKTAIASQPDEPLAWKGLANYYDKHPPSGREEVEDALQTYHTLLTHVDNDLGKKRATLSTLATLYHTMGGTAQTGGTAQLVATYTALIDTYTAGEEEEEKEGVTRVWVQLTDLLLSESVMTESAWDMVQQLYNRQLCAMLLRGVEVVLGEVSGCDEESRLNTRERFIPLLLDHHKEDEGVWDMLQGHCRAVLDTRPSSLPALTAMAYLTLEDLIKLLPEEPGSEWMTEWTQKLLETLYMEEGAGVNGGGMKGGGVARGGEARGGEGAERGGEGLERGGGRGRGLGCVGMACVRVAHGQWRDACTLFENGLSLCPSLCEAHLLLSWTHLKQHSFTASLQHAHAGLGVLDKCPPVLAEQAGWKLKLLEARAELGLGGEGHTQQALSIMLELSTKGSCDRHVIVTLTRAHLALGDIEQAQKAVQSLLSSSDGDSATVNMLQGEVCLAQQNYGKAVTWFDSVLECVDQSWVPDCLLMKGLALWKMTDSRTSYATLLKAAKADPYNPEVMLYIGHYQRQVAGDTSRALKCYQKAVQLQPDHMEALSCAGDLLFTAGREEEAFDVYSEITKRVPAAKAKHAWLRLGLYHRQKGQFNDAIHCFQNSLTADTSDKQCWECLAEAYLARGSHSSALRTFARVVELDPQSVYCLYQLGNINQVCGELCEAVSRYSAVLALQPHYLPALKGRGHTHYLLALSSLRQNFDARAVDLVSKALCDLTRAASIKPRFLCVWKLIGNCCTCLYQVHPNTARPVIPEVLLGKGGSLEATAVMDKTELFLVGCRSFARALQLSPECSSLWHDLALAYYHLTQIATTDEKKTEYVRAAFNVTSKALGLSPGDHTHWNLLGVIAAHSAIDRQALAQHAFIRSLQLESNNGLAWTNLGTLYLKHGHIQLAHKAFAAAQSVDPGYAAAWIGQATIAHNIGHADCMDLYRHTTELDSHREGSRGYGYWVCHTLTTLDPGLILEPGAETLNQVATRGLLQARDCLQKLVEREPADGWLLNLLGLLYEQEGLLAQAERAFRKAGELLVAKDSIQSGSHCVAVSVNRARVLSALGRHPESLELWSAINPSATDFSAQLHLALALYRAGNYTDSLQVYEGVVEMAEEKQRSAVLSACAMVVYALGDTHKCRTFLFKAFQTSPPSLHALVGLCVIGCLTLDLTLLQTALLEMNKIVEWKSWDGQILHNSCLLALRIIRHSSHVGSECVEAASTLLNQLSDKQQYVEQPPLPLGLPLLAGCAVDTLVIHAQKMLHSYPSSVWSMAAFTHAVQQQGIKTQLQAAVLLQYIQNELPLLDPSSKDSSKALEKLQVWLKGVANSF